MGFDNDCILNIQSLPGEYFCPVCHLLVYPNEALQAQCTHLYCKPCLTYTASTLHACPYDGYRVVEADAKPLPESNKTLADTIGKIQVHCLYYRTGCTWQGSLSDCTSHCSLCAYGESPVLRNRCGIQIVHRQVQEHAQNCSGVQSQAQQRGGVQDAKSAGAGAVPEQSQPAAQTGAAASQPQASQESAQPVSSQDANQAANAATQPQAAQAAVPIPEQWYQQQQQYQQQYQQYYQQYPGYDPYQQNYQYYYQYPQAAQQYQQQPTQAYGQAQPQAYGQAQPQAYGQAQPQAYGQAQPQAHGQAQPQAHGQAQPQLQAQQQGQPQVQGQPQAPPQAVQAQQQPLAQPQPQAQPSVNMQAQAQSIGQTQPQMHAQSQGPPPHPAPYNQSQPLPQSQPNSVPQQQMQVPQYQQAHPQMQNPHPQTYQQSQPQHYPYPQSQPYSHLNPQAPAHPPSQLNQTTNPSTHQPQNAVTGYQSYPQQQQHPQAQVGAAQQVHPTGIQQPSQYPGQVQGQFPVQAPQAHPPQPYAAVPMQQQHAMLSAQGQPPSGPPAQQMPVYPHAQQAGYPFQQRPGVQAAQQATSQQFMQPQSSMQAQLHLQGPSQIQQQAQPNYVPQHGAQPNMAQNYAGRQLVPQGAMPQPYFQGVGLAAGQGRPSQPNEIYPMRINSQLSAASEQQAAAHSQKPLNTADGEKPHDPMSEKGVQDQDDRNKEARNLAAASGAGGLVDQTKKIKSESGSDEAADGNESKRDLSLASGSELPGSKQVVENGVHGVKPGRQESSTDGVPEALTTGGTGKGGAGDLKKVELQDFKHTDKGKVASTSMLTPHLGPQGHGSNTFPSIALGRSHLQPLHHGHSAQQRPGVPSMPQSMPLPGNPQQPALPNQLCPQGLGQGPPGPPFNAVDNAHLKHPHGPPFNAVDNAHLKHPHGPSGPFGRPNVGQYQGPVPPHLAGQPPNVKGDPVRPSLTAQRLGSLDCHSGLVGRELLPRPDVDLRPPYPPEIEKFPAQRSSYFDGRLPDSLPPAPVERGPFGPAPPGAAKFNGPLTLDSMSAPGMRDERFKPFPEEHMKPFSHREFDDDVRKFPRPSHLEAGPSSKFGAHFPSSGPRDQVHMFGVDGLSRPFGKGSHGLDRDSGVKMDTGVGSVPASFLPPFHPNDVSERARGAGFPDDSMGRKEFVRQPGPAPGPGFGRHHMDGLPPRSPGGDYAGFPSHTFGASRNVGGNEPRSFPGERFWKLIHDSRFPVLRSHLLRGELDDPGNLCMGDRLAGGPHNQDMLRSHLRRGEHMEPRNLHLGEGNAFGPPGGLPRMGEPPFPQHLSFGESFGVEKPGNPLLGEPGFRSNLAYQRFARDGGFFPGEMEAFDNPRKRKVGSIMCRICKVECGTVDGLDLHSQSREHQRRAMDMVISIKQQNKKQKKTLHDQASGEGNKPKSSGFEGRGNKR